MKFEPLHPEETGEIRQRQRFLLVYLEIRAYLSKDVPREAVVDHRREPALRSAESSKVIAHPWLFSCSSEQYLRERNIDPS